MFEDSLRLTALGDLAHLDGHNLGAACVPAGPGRSGA